MRNEQAFKSYTLENVAFHVLRKRSVDFPSVSYDAAHRNDITRMPLYSFSTLTRWFNGGIPAHTALLLRYFFERTSVVLMILEEAEVITKTACARSQLHRTYRIELMHFIQRVCQSIWS
jgi:DNA polymerase zeta